MASNKMLEYVKYTMGKKFLKVLSSKEDISYHEIVEKMGLSEDIILEIMTMMKGTFEELESENEYIYRITEKGKILENKDISVWKNSLQKFDQIKILEEESEILENGDPLEFLSRAVSTIHKGDNHLIPLAILVGITPWMNTERLHIYPVGMSGKGKSDLCASVINVFPKNMYEVVSTSSPKSIYYAYAAGLIEDNKIIFFDDVKSSMEFVEIIKAFTGSSKIKTRHWTVDIKRRFMDIKPSGRYSIWFTSVVPIIDDQLKNRFIIANVDESFEQDKRVFEHVDRIFRDANENKVLNQELFEKCRNIISIICAEPTDVIIPYKINFPMLFDRRAYIFFLVLIKACTFIYKFQRPVAENGSLISTKIDFEIVKYIYEKIKQFQTTKLEQNALNVLMLLPTNPEDSLTRTQISQKLGLGTSTVARICHVLLENGFINHEKISGSWHYWRYDDERVNALLNSITYEFDENNILKITKEQFDEINNKSSSGNNMIKFMTEGEKKNEEENKVTKPSAAEIFTGIEKDETTVYYEDD